MEGTNQSKYEWPKVVLFGDSLTQYSFDVGGWGAMIANKLQRKCDVLNRGFSGYNSRWNKIVLPRLFPTRDSARGIAAFVIFMGANDSSSAELNLLQHVPAEEYKQKLKCMVEYLQSLGLNKEIILMGPPACDTEAWSKTCIVRGVAMAKDNDVVDHYNKLCEQAAKETGCQFLDIYTPMMSAQNWSAFLSDGLHLSEHGSQFIFQHLWPVLERLKTDCSLRFPDWHEFQTKDPIKTLQNF